jgi:hypothetical protein
MRLCCLAVTIFLMLPANARADEQTNCVAAHEEGQVARRDGRFDRARAAFAACQRDECPAAVRSRCSEFARELEAAQPSLVVIVRDVLGTDVRGARVSVDDAPSSDVSAMGLRLNPGSHTVRVEAPGFLPSEKTIVLPEGSKNMQATFSLERPRGLPTLPLAQPAAAKPATAALAFAIGGGVSLVTAGVLSGVGWGIRDNLKSSCGAVGCTENQVEPLRVVWPAAFIALGVGVASAVVATILFVTHRQESARWALVLGRADAGIRF